jgi:hypothetical protein
VVLQLVSVFLPNKLRTFLCTYKENKFFCFIFSLVFVFLQLVIFFNSLYFLPKEIRILVHIFLGGLGVGHRVLPKQTQELFGSKKEIGILVSLLLGFLCLFFSFSKRKDQDFLLARNRDFISFFHGFFWQFSFFGAREKPGFMVTGNRDFTSFFHEFCSWFRFFCSWLLSLCCVARKTGFTVIFSRICFYCWLFSFELLSLSLLPKKSQELW